MTDRIATLELFLLPPRWAFLRLSTEEGLVGWGEPVIEGKAETVIAAVNEMKDQVIGHDANKIEDLYQILYRGSFYRGGPVLMSAISGIEQALWDIKGKRLGVPIYELLGGACRDHVQAYSWVGGDEPQQTAEAAKKRVEAGWRAVKMNAVPRVGWLETPAKIDALIKEISTVRDAIGWDVGLGLDFHGRVRRGLCKTLLKELEPLKPLFVEEPTLPEHEDTLEDLVRRTSIPIATGERLFGRKDFIKLLGRNCVDIIQPDLCHTGGIWEARKIAAIAEAYDVAVAPHCPLGPIALASSLQLDFCTPNAILQETSLGIHYNRANGGAELTDYLLDESVFSLEKGNFMRSNRPGLGIEIDEDVVRESAKRGHQWRNPLWRHEDGSVAEW